MTPPTLWLSIHPDKIPDLRLIGTIYLLSACKDFNNYTVLRFACIAHLPIFYLILS